MLNAAQAYYRALFPKLGIQPLFVQPDWLDFVAGEKWSAVAWPNWDHPQGLWPFVLSRNRFRLKQLTLPMLTQHLGPIILLPSRLKPANRLRYEDRVICGLVSQLPVYHLLNVNLSPDVFSWYGLYKLGFKQTTRYTYRLPVLSPQETVSSYSSELRQKLKYATAYYTAKVIPGVAPDLYPLIQRLYARKKLVIPFTKQHLASLNERFPGRVTTVLAIDANNQTVASILIIKDESFYYSLITAINPQARFNPGSLAYHTAIAFSHAQGLGFDFEGSMIPGVAAQCREFGGQAVGFHQVTHIPNPLIRKLYQLRG